MNKVIMIGNLTKDFNLKYLNTGTAVGESSLAVNRPYKTQDGKNDNEVCYIDLSMYGRTAEVCNQYLKKGSKICVEGRLVFQQWQDQHGNKRNKHILSVEKVEFLNNRDENNQEITQAKQEQAMRVEASINLNSIENDLESMLKNHFNIYKDNDSDKMVVCFHGTRDNYELAKTKWEGLFHLIKTKYPNKEFLIKRDIADEQEIPF